MTAPDASRMRVIIHLLQQATVGFHAGQLWPLEGQYARFGNDLPSFAQEVMRRFRADGYVGFAASAEEITVIPHSSVKRIDFVLESTNR